MYSLNKRITISLIIFGMLISACSIFFMYSIFRASLMEFANSVKNVSTQVVVTNGLYSEIISSTSTERETAILEFFWLRYQWLILLILLVMSLLSVGVSFIISNFLIRPLKAVGTFVKQLDFESDAPLQLASVPTEVQPLIETIYSSHQSLRKAYNESEQFQSYAAHELRNELLALQGMVELGEHAVAVDYINKLNQTVEDLLVLSQVAGTVADEQVDVALLLAELVDRFASKMIIDFVFEDTDVALFVKGKETWIYRCFYNLLENAFKFHRVGTEVTLVLELVGDSIVVIVSNDLQAVDESAYGALWQSRYTTAKNGNGIGLQLVAHVAELLNGYAYYESDETSIQFYISLPLWK